MVLFTLTILIWGSSLILMTLTFIGRSVAYMPYAEVKRALEQEARMRGAAAGPASPRRLSPREGSRAAPPPAVSAARSSAPPGKYRASAPRLPASAHSPRPACFTSRTRPCCFQLLSRLSASHPQLYSVEVHGATGKSVFICVSCDVDCLFF